MEAIRGHGGVMEFGGRSRRTAWIAALLFCCAAAVAPAAAKDADFDAWVAELKAEALAQGFREATVEAALSNVRVLSEVVESDRSQPKAPTEFCDYMTRRLTTTRIARGRKMLAEHRKLLVGINADYGIPPRYIVALWGLETNFGDYVGDIPLFDALVTLARDPRRGEFFRKQIFGALRIVDEGHHPVEGLTGSWAGATGHVQFMPTTYLAYAVDRDGDGRRDLWNSLPDAFASAANYLRRSGWRLGETWGRQVRLPGEVGSKGPKSLAKWQQLGVRRIDGRALPNARQRATLVLPTPTRAPAFLTYRNYRAFLAWNRSTFFAISVGTLADALTGVASLEACGL
jgi:membrane-bound lytic murein transglycosylase B